VPDGSVDVRSLLGRPVQVAYAVRDVEAAAARFAESTGAGPFFLNRHIAVTSTRVHGSPAPFDHSSAYGQWGDVMVELVEEHTPPIVEPGSGVHHMAFFVDDTAAAVATCVAHGWPEALWADTSSGLSFAFCDAQADLGHLVELYEPRQRLLGFYAMIADAARGWDGSRPVRELG
jgi:catechol 2,3-dioxygenase-like lactoylglutathione lyase family enzyme